MHSQSTSPESWIGKLVWAFLRDDAGLPVSNKAECGVVIDLVRTRKGHYNPRGNVWVVQVGDNYYHAWEGDMEEVEDWDDSEGEDCSMETTGERTREYDRDSFE